MSFASEKLAWTMTRSRLSFARCNPLLFRRLVAALSAAVGFTVLLHWWTGSHPLSLSVSGADSMHPSAALGFLFAALCLFLLSSPHPSAKRVVNGCIIFLAALATLSLLKAATGWDFCLDEFLVPARVRHAAIPRTMPPNAAICFLLLAGGLWLMRGSGKRFARPIILGWLGALILGIGLFSLISHAAPLEPRLEQWGLTRMAIHTAALFLLLGATILSFAWEQTQMQWSIGIWRTAEFAFGLSLLVAVAAYSYQSTHNLTRGHTGIIRTDQFIARIRELQTRLEETESAMRGYIITGSDEFLIRSQTNVAKARQDLRDLISLRESDPNQNTRLNLLRSKIGERLILIEHNIDLRSQFGFEAAKAGLEAEPNRKLLDQTRALLSQVEIEESRLLKQREAYAAAITNRTFATLPIGLLLSMLFLAQGLLRLNNEVTARQRGAEALRLNQRRLNLALDAAQIGDWELDLVTHAIRRSLKYDQIFGYPALQPIWTYEVFLEHVHPEDRTRVDQSFQATLANGSDWSAEFRILRHDKSIGWIWGRGRALRDPAGQLTEMLGMIGDITQSKRAQVLLSWEKSALDLIGSSSRLPEVLDGLMRGLEELSPGTLCSVLLLDPDGIHLRHGAAPSLPDAYNRLIDGAEIGPNAGSCGTAAYFNRQVIVTDIASDPLWADYSELALSHGLRACWSTPIHDQRGKILGTFAIYYREIRQPSPEELELINRALRITGIAIERKQAEAQILELNLSLERRVRERTAQLENALKELDAFSYSISHDLRAPLRAADGFASLLLEDYSDSLDANGRRMLGIIRAQTQRMGQLIDDLLTFSKLSRQPLVHSRIDMHSLAQETFEELLALEPGRSVEFDLHPLPPIEGSLPMIRQVWANLLSNALKFTRNRHPARIQVGFLPAPANALYVQDNGAGFDMRFSDKLFGVFQRLHSDHEFPGTGIGLALVQRILQRHEGRIWAHAQPDQGATFYFSLPLVDPALLPPLDPPFEPPPERPILASDIPNSHR